MSSGEWFCIRNWRRFQNYSDRNPPWVRWYTDQLEDEGLRAMKPMTRLFWSQVCLVGARKDGVIPNDAAWLAREMAMSRQAVTSALKELEQAGNLRFFASKADCIEANKRDSASRDARTETETEELKSTTPSSALSKTTRSEEPASESAGAKAPPRSFVCSFAYEHGPCGVTFKTEEALQAHQANVHTQLNGTTPARAQSPREALLLDKREIPF